MRAQDPHEPTRPIRRHLAVLAFACCAAATGGGRAPVRAIALAPTSVTSFTATLTGPHESPANASPGTGTAVVTIDSVAQTMRVQITFSGLLANNTAAHIHATTATPFAGNAGVATTTPTFTSFPTGTTSGTYDHTFDMTSPGSYNPAFVTATGGVAAAEAALFAAIANETAYVNIHSTLFPGGEIRGFTVPQFTSDPMVPGFTIDAAHVTQLRQRIDAQRLRYGLLVYGWTDATLTPGSTPVKGTHVAELRQALVEAYMAASRTPPTFADPVLSSDTTIAAVHIAQLRAAVVSLEN